MCGDILPFWIHFEIWSTSVLAHFLKPMCSRRMEGENPSGAVGIIYWTPYTLVSPVRLIGNTRNLLTFFLCPVRIQDRVGNRLKYHSRYLLLFFFFFCHHMFMTWGYSFSFLHCYWWIFDGLYYFHCYCSFNQERENSVIWLNFAIFNWKFFSVDEIFHTQKRIYIDSTHSSI